MECSILRSQKMTKFTSIQRKVIFCWYLWIWLLCGTRRLNNLNAHVCGFPSLGIKHLNFQVVRHIIIITYSNQKMRKVYPHRHMWMTAFDFLSLILQISKWLIHSASLILFKLYQLLFLTYPSEPPSYNRSAVINIMFQNIHTCLPSST